MIAAQALFTAIAALGKHFQDTEMARLERRSCEESNNSQINILILLFSGIINYFIT